MDIDHSYHTAFWIWQGEIAVEHPCIEQQNNVYDWKGPGS